MELIWTIIIGFVVGLLARFLKPGDDSMGFIMTILLGVAGAFVAKFIGQAAGLYTQGQTASFIASVVGAMLLLVIVSFLRPKVSR